MATATEPRPWYSAKIDALQAEVDQLRAESERLRRIAHTMACAVAVNPKVAEATRNGLLRTAEYSDSRARRYERDGEPGVAAVAREAAEIDRAAADEIDRAAASLAEIAPTIMSSRQEPNHG